MEIERTCRNGMQDVREGDYLRVDDQTGKIRMIVLEIEYNRRGEFLGSFYLRIRFCLIVASI